MNTQTIKAMEEMEAKMAEAGMLRIFELNIEKFGSRVAFKALLAFMDDVKEMLDETEEE